MARGNRALMRNYPGTRVILMLNLFRHGKGVVGSDLREAENHAEAGQMAYAGRTVSESGRCSDRDDFSCKAGILVARIVPIRLNGNACRSCRWIPQVESFLGRRFRLPTWTRMSAITAKQTTSEHIESPAFDQDTIE